MLECLEGIAEAQSDALAVTFVVLDGTVTVQMLKPGSAKSFEEYVHQVFIPYVKGRLRGASCLDLGDCDKGKRGKRGAAVCGEHQSYTRKLAEFPTC